MMAQNNFPPGWNEKKIREVIEHYDSQTEEEAAAEIEAATEGYTLMEVPVELIPLFRSLIARHEQGVSLEALQESFLSKSAFVETNDPA
jgi:hypothetical protein